MPVYKAVLYWHDQVGNYGWSVSNHLEDATIADAFNEVNDFNSAYLTIATTAIFLDGCTLQDITPGSPSRFYPSTSFAMNAGVKATTFPPIADGLLWQGYGTAVTKGRAEWLFHGISDDYQVGYNQWDPLAADLVSFNTSCFDYFNQFRAKASHVHAWPIVNPPTAFFTWRLNNFIRLRRVGRPLSRGGQGLRSRS